MIEQKMRDDHDSTKKRGQFDNFLKKIDYLKETYPNKKIEAGMWFVDNSLKKNRRYYENRIATTEIKNVEMFLFYGVEFTNHLAQTRIWDEMENHLLAWKMSEDNVIELNFENGWEDTKEELLEFVPKKNWEKIIKNENVMQEIIPILFPSNKYLEILDELGIRR